MDDRALVRRMLQGEEAAFESFFEAHFQRLFRFALGRAGGDADLAEEVVQATLVQAVRRLETWRGEAALFTWLCSICRRELGERWARAGREPQRASLDDDAEVRASLELLARECERPDRMLERRDLARLVQAALDHLPPRYGDVLEWKYIQGLAVAEIAGRLNATPKAVESLLARARQAFREGFASLVPPAEVP